MKKFPQGSSTTVMLIWRLKQVKYFIFKFPINESFCWGTQNYYMYYIQYCLFLLQVEMLITYWLALMPNLSRMLIWCAFHSVTKIQRYFGNREGICQIWPELIIICIHTHLIHNWWWKHKLKVIIRNQKIKGAIICGP